MNSLKLLFAINVRWWNAEAAYAIHLAKAFQENGHEVWVIVNQNSIVFKKAKEYKINVLESVELDTKNPFLIWKYYQTILHQIDQHNIQIINSFKSNGSFLFSYIKKKRPHIQYFKTRGEARPPKYHFLNNWLYGKSGCDGVITASKLVEQWIRNLKIPNQKVQTIYYGTSPTVKFSKEISEVFMFQYDAPLLALIGRTQTLKGHMVLLRAFLNIEFKKPNLIFFIKDLEEYPENLSEIKTFIQKYRLEAYVKIVGFQKNLEQYIQKLDLVVIPSLESEVNCRVAVESFAQGIPVLAFPTGSLPEIITHKKTGYICEEKTELSLKKGIKWCLEDIKRLKQLGRHAKVEHRNKFSSDIFYQKTLHFYHSDRKTLPFRGRI